MPAAVEQAQRSEQASETQSSMLVRNMLRLEFSNILYTRGSFPESDFHLVNLDGFHSKSLGGEDVSEKAQTLITWLEKGIFEAISQGFLDKAILCISEDEEADQMASTQHTLNWRTQHSLTRSQLSVSRMTRAILRSSRRGLCLSSGLRMPVGSSIRPCDLAGQRHRPSRWQP